MRHHRSGLLARFPNTPRAARVAHDFSRA